MKNPINKPFFPHGKNVTKKLINKLILKFPNKYNYLNVGKMALKLEFIT